MIERHVCSLALSRKLAEAGFPQECIMAWYAGHDSEDYATLNAGPHADLICAAPLLSEIMEQMPAASVSAWYWPKEESAERWSVMPGPSCKATTGPDAAALLWLALRGEK